MVTKLFGKKVPDTYPEAELIDLGKACSVLEYEEAFLTTRVTTITRRIFLWVLMGQVSLHHW
jgi:hypothetical protein